MSNLKKLTNQELLELRNRVQEEISSRVPTLEEMFCMAVALDFSRAHKTHNKKEVAKFQSEYKKQLKKLKEFYLCPT